MGGEGSTRWRRHLSAWQVEECADLRIALLTPALKGATAPTGSRTWSLTRALTALARWDVRWSVHRGVEGVVWVDVASTVQRGGQTRQGGARLDVDETTPRYGGVRSWWLCPACGGRVTTLYLPPGVSAPACRRCYRLTYKTRQAHDKRDDRYRRLPPWERLALLHDRATMSQEARDIDLDDVPIEQRSRALSRAMAQVIASADDTMRLVDSLKAPRHSMDYYERRANR